MIFLSKEPDIKAFSPSISITLLVVSAAIFEVSSSLSSVKSLIISSSILVPVLSKLFVASLVLAIITFLSSVG